MKCRYFNGCEHASAEECVGRTLDLSAFFAYRACRYRFQDGGDSEGGDSDRDFDGVDGDSGVSAYERTVRDELGRMVGGDGEKSSIVEQLLDID